MVIYKAENKINGKVYIGKTIRKLISRKNNHISDAKNGQNKTYFHRSLLKYGFENFEWSILCESDCPEKLKKLERFYIATYKLFIGLYNMTEGGEGVCLPGSKNPFYGKKHSEETKKRWSAKRKGVKNPTMKRDVVFSKNPFYGKKHSEETLKKISEKLKRRDRTLTRGESHPAFGKEGIRSRAVFQLNAKTGEIIKQWRSISAVKESLRIGHVSEVCRGHLATSGGFRWEYAGEPQTKRVSQINYDNGSIEREWGSISEASKSLQINRSSIESVCRRKKMTAGGFKWKYCDD